jgi:hypothetical protein
LDYDSSKKLSLEATVKDGARKAGVEVMSMRVLRNSDMAQKMMIGCAMPDGVRGELKIGARIRQVPLAEVEKTQDGLLVYTPQKQLAQKTATAGARGNRAPRDWFDIAFLAKKYPEATEAKADALRVFANNPDSLLNFYRASWEDDPVLSSKPIADAVLSIMEAVDNLPKLTVSAHQRLMQNKIGMEPGQNIRMGQIQFQSRRPRLSP